MRLLIPLQLEMDSTKEPPEAATVHAASCPTCYAIVPSNRLADHQRVAHPEGA